MCHKLHLTTHHVSRLAYDQLPITNYSLTALMTTPRFLPTWRVIGASVCGATHLRAHRPNQDAIRWAPEHGAGSPLMVAVADGHGSGKSFRSAIGAMLAVEAATIAIDKLLREAPCADAQCILRALSSGRLSFSIVDTWQQLATAHLTTTPFTEAEWTELASSDGGIGRAMLEANPLIAYGATLLAVVALDDGIAYLQLGDGDILLVSERGEVSRPRWPKDPRLLGNRTTSLCTDDAVYEMNVDVQTFDEALPALIMVSTDGYANSFQSTAGFEQVGSDLLQLMRAEGLKVVQQNLGAWLAETSQEGSGDDITVGLLCRADVLCER